MITINEVSSAVYGAYRLAKRDPGGMAYFDLSAEGALKSFYAAALIIPFEFARLTANRWEFLTETDSIPTWFVLESLVYVIDWTLIPVLMIPVARWIDRWDRFCEFVAAYNWSHVIITAAFLPLHTLRLTGLIPLGLFQFLGMGLLFAALFYLWFVFKVSLKISGGMAASLVAAQYVIGLLLFQISKLVIYGG